MFTNQQLKNRMLLMIDNFDSFTYNLVHYFGELGANVRVIKNNELSIEAIAALNPAKIVISPGPGNPDEAGISIEIINYFSGVIPILGVCLGHQCIAQAFGAKIIHAKKLMHGKVSMISHQQQGIFQTLPTPLKVARYHSLAVDQMTLPACLEVTAQDELGEVMAIQHTTWPLVGIQFHPESILTEHGHHLLKNFLEYRC